MRGTKPLRGIEESLERDGAIRPGERVLIACSGGSDSVALAALLRAVAKPMGLSLSMGHVNHGLRRSAWQDEAVALRASAALRIPLHVIALENQKPDEASLREGRYAALEGLASRCGADVVATGHNAEDQTETLLLALFRGTGLQGLAGMPPRRQLNPSVVLARPLLRFERSLLRSYVCDSALPYAIDPSNLDRHLRRNAVRQALASLRPLFPGLDSAVARTAEIVSGELGQTPASAARKQVRETLQEQEALRDVDFGHVEAAVRALQTGGSGRFHMKAGVELRVEKGTFKVERD